MIYKKAAQLIEAERFDEAYELLMDLVKNNGTDEQALFLLGMCFRYSDNFGMAALTFEKVFALNPSRYDALNNLGMALEGLGQDDDAREVFKKAEALHPTAMHRSNIALTYLHQNNYTAARYWAKKALELEPDMRHVKITMGFCDLAAGDWANGWKGFKETLGKRYRPDVNYGLPEWDGSLDKRVLVFGDQGVGDEIMYASCLPALVNVSKSVTYDTDRRLRDLFAVSFKNVKVYGTRNMPKPWFDPNAYDAKVAVATLPLHFRPTPGSCPRVPYLDVSNELFRMYSALVNPGAYQRHLGICWSGGMPLTGAKRRRIELATLAPIINHFVDRGWTIHSLEYNVNEAQRDIDASGLPIKNHHFALSKGTNLEHTAAYIATMDHVLGVDTTAHHIAGALGVPSSILVHDPAMWNFGEYQKNALCWYRNVRLFRQDSKLDGAASECATAQDYQNRWKRTLDRLDQEIINHVSKT